MLNYQKHCKVLKYIQNAIVLIILFFFLVCILFPILIILFNSFKLEEEFYEKGPFAIPLKISWGSIKTAAGYIQFFKRITNSILISIPTTILATILSMLNGYALGIGRVKGKTFFLIFFLIGLTLPQEAFVYPLYYIFRSINIYNTRFGVVLILTMFHLSFGTYLMKSVMETFPKDFIDSARIDGANKFYILFRIVTPLVMPTLSVLFVFFFIWTWNDFFISLIFLITEKVQTLPLGILRLRGQYRVDMTYLAAAALLLCLPCIIFFFVFQRTLTRGIITAGIKG